MERTDSQEHAFYKPPTSISQRSWVRYTFFFLAGMIVGLLLMKVLDNLKTGISVSDNEVRGTLYNSSSFEKMKPADVIMIDNAVVKSTIDVRYSTQIIEARIDVSTSNPVMIAIEFSYNDLRVLNVQNLMASDQSTILSSSSFVQIQNAGDNKYIIQWLNQNRLPHRISFKFLQNDMVIYSNTVTVNKE